VPPYVLGAGSLRAEPEESSSRAAEPGRIVPISRGGRDLIDGRGTRRGTLQLTSQLASLRPAQRGPDVAGSTPPEGNASLSLSLSNLLQILRRRILLFIAVTVLITGLTAVMAFLLTPLYDAEAVLVLDARKSRITNVQDVVSELPTDNPAVFSAVVRSELDVLKSRPLIAQVIARTNLMNEPEFNPDLRAGPSLLGRALQERLSQWFNSWRGKPVAGETQGLARTIDAYLDHLIVRTDGRSMTVRLNFRSENPELAARVVNTHAELYVASQTEAKIEATRRANAWLVERIDGLRNQVQSADQALQTYLVEHQLSLIPAPESATVHAKQLSDMARELVVARAERVQAEARVEHAREILRRAGNIQALPEVVNSPTIQRLRAQEVEVIRQEAGLADRYIRNSAALLDARAQLRGVRDRIDAEIENIVQSLANAVEVATAREAEIQKEFERLQSMVSSSDVAKVKLWELEREAEASRALLTTFQKRFHETAAVPIIDVPDARFVSPASVPNSHSFPRRKLVVAIGFIFAMMCATGLAIAAERSDSGMRSPDEIERLTGVQALGLVPFVKHGNSRQGPAAQLVIDGPASVYTECIRSVRTNFALARAAQRPVIVTITSALPGDGKTTLATSLARSSAIAGRSSLAPQKTILVDCDLRRSGVTRQLQRGEHPNILDALMERCSIEAAIQQEDSTGLHFIAAPSHIWNSADLLDSEPFARLLTRLRERYDRVFIDTPPVLVAADAVVVGKRADALLLAVRWGTPAAVVRKGIKQIRAADIEPAGTIVTRVDLKRHARYGYVDDAYVYRYYGGYFGRSP
jgi:succinoglycan biosynthesis transport protein ExoP